MITKRISDEINKINRIITNFCGKIAHEHHKSKDEMWQIKFAPAWRESYVIAYNGYWLDDIWIESDDLLDALVKFRKELQARIKREIANYDFENHCGKEVIE